ncbi:MAG: MBL fold metallo-hydrolase [Bacteroidia bacterium]|nr:MBL fold metallo-hydrolase [Bacteroidia bacterium]
MTFGRYEIFLIESGRFRLDGGAMFGVVPKPMWEKVNEVDAQNRVAMTMRSLVLRDEKRVILVDTGVGDKDGEKFQSIYAIDHSQFRLADQLAALGIATEDVTDVVLTHLHFDHVGGCVRRMGERLEPVFTHARHYVQQRHWDWAMRPSDKDKASFIPDNYLPLHDAGLLSFLDGETELFEGLHLEIVNGHTFAQQMVRIAGDGRSLLYAADLIPMSAHIPAPWIMSYDLQPLVTLEEKLRVLDRSAREGDIVLFEHDTGTEAASIVRTEKGYTAGVRGRLADVLNENAA